jgi:hypothetical protein
MTYDAPLVVPVVVLVPELEPQPVASREIMASEQRENR